VLGDNWGEEIGQGHRGLKFDKYLLCEKAIINTMSRSTYDNPMIIPEGKTGSERSKQEAEPKHIHEDPSPKTAFILFSLIVFLLAVLGFELRASLARPTQWVELRLCPACLPPPGSGWALGNAPPSHGIGPSPLLGGA
jgi:hypothetical protein